ERTKAFWSAGPHSAFGTAAAARGGFRDRAGERGRAAFGDHREGVARRRGYYGRGTGGGGAGDRQAFPPDLRGGSWQGRFDRPEVGGRTAFVRVGIACASAGLHCHPGRVGALLRLRVGRLAALAEEGGKRDRSEDGEDHRGDEQLDQGEARLVEID